MIIRGLKKDKTFEGIEIDPHDEEMLMALAVRYIIENCTLEEVDGEHHIHLHMLPDHVYEGKIQ